MAETAVGNNLWAEIYLDGEVTINVASGTAGDTYTVTLLIEE